MKNVKLGKALSVIEIADDIILNELIQSVIRRYRILHPDWEVLFYSLHREGDERSADIVRLIRTLEAEMNAKRTPSGEGVQFGLGMIN